MMGNLHISFTVSCTAQICMEVAANGRSFATLIKSISHEGVVEQWSVTKHTIVMETTAPNLSYFSMKPTQEVCVLQKSSNALLWQRLLQSSTLHLIHSKVGKQLYYDDITTPYTKHLNIKHVYTIGKIFNSITLSNVWFSK